MPSATARFVPWIISSQSGVAFAAEFGVDSGQPCLAGRVDQDPVEVGECVVAGRAGGLPGAGSCSSPSRIFSTST